MKKFGILLAATILGGLPLTAAAFGGGRGGGHPGMALGHAGVGPHTFNRSSFAPAFRSPAQGNRFMFRHDGRFDGRAFAHDGRFFRHHHRFFRSSVVLVDLGFPYYYPYYYYPYPYDGYLYDYYYPYDSGTYGAAEAHDLAVAVQSELARLGYYRGPIDGQFGPGTRRAIRAFQAAKGLPVTDRIDPKFLRVLERS